VIKRKCVNYNYVKDKKKLVIILREYYTEVNRLFVFQCFSDVFKRGSCKIEKDSLGLAKKDKVSGKEEVVSKDTNKKPINSRLKSCWFIFAILYKLLL
jgi:hypothetical protein